MDLRAGAREGHVRSETVSPAMQNVNCLYLGQLWLPWVVQHPLFVFLVGRMCWLTCKATIWAVGTTASWLSNHFLTSDF